MQRSLITSSAIGLILAFSAGYATAAAPDWSKVPSKKIVLLYPGASPMEWITKGTEHGGAKAFKKGLEGKIEVQILEKD